VAVAAGRVRPWKRLQRDPGPCALRASEGGGAKRPFGCTVAGKISKRTFHALRELETQTVRTIRHQGGCPTTGTEDSRERQAPGLGWRPAHGRPVGK
jgi:hypothetical protein